MEEKEKGKYVERSETKQSRVAFLTHVFIQHRKEPMWKETIMKYEARRYRNCVLNVVTGKLQVWTCVALRCVTSELALCLI